MTGCEESHEVTDIEAADPGGSSRLSELLRDDTGTGFPRVTVAREFDFPGDHGPHPEFRNEWWYFTGNLDGEDGGRYGFELILFRFSLTPNTAARTGSAWETNQVFIGHFAISDVAGRAFHVAQRYSRGAAGLAGAQSAPFRVWLEDWSIGETAGGLPWRLQASDGKIAVDLELEPLKPVVLNGDNGLSQKSAEAGNASYYYSMPRLGTRGTLRLGETSVAVNGLSWLDREWGSSALARNQRGWDWFALQFSDGSDLMFYRLRRNDGSVDDYSSGTWIDADGMATHLARNDVQVDVTEYWDSGTGGRYPSGWNLRIPGKDLSIAISPALKDQELITNVRYWEGAVDIAGHSAGAEIGGRGYVELTGYAED